MYYLIFKNVKFVGYTDNQVFIKRLIKERSTNYTVHEITELNLEKNLIEDYELIDLESDSRLLFMYEFKKLDKIVTDRLIRINDSLESIVSLIYYVKLSKEERMIVDHYLILLNDMLNDLLHTTERGVSYEEYLDIEDILNVLVGKKH